MSEHLQESFPEQQKMKKKRMREARRTKRKKKIRRKKDQEKKEEKEKEEKKMIEGRKTIRRKDEQVAGVDSNRVRVVAESNRWTCQQGRAVKRQVSFLYLLHFVFVHFFRMDFLLIMNV